MPRRLLAFLLLLLSALAPLAPANAQGADVAVTWRLLDYIAVDYAGAVAGGKVISEGEYAEMKEFSASVEARLATLPPGPVRDRLTASGKSLSAAIAAKAPPREVDRMARGLADALIAAYPVPLAPPSAPDLARGAALYAQNCASCHGITAMRRLRSRRRWIRRRSPSPTALERRSGAPSPFTR